MGLIRSIQATTSGLTAQRVRLDTIGGNVANLETTRTPDGSGPYRRHVVRFTAGGDGMPFAQIVGRFTGGAQNGVVVTEVGIDNTSPTRQVFDPAHPDAAEDGYVELPNIDLVTEMTDLTSANRSYQANVTVLNAIKEMALRALDISSR
jgi:flagellar basal-body rod protein FlgC